MSLAGTVTYWDTARKNSAVREQWLVRLYYDDEGAADYIGLSDSDITVGTFYAGLIIDYGNITERIDLLNSSGAVGNLSLNCVNKWGSGTLSDKLWPSSSAYFINRKVEVYSRFGDATAIADCRLIYEGRLFNFTQNKYTITLDIEQKQPQDFIQIPIAVNDDNVPLPVVYGNYTPTASTTGSEGYIESKTFFPCPVTALRRAVADAADFVGVVQGAIAADGNPHYYEKSIDGFAPLEPVNDVSEVYRGSSVIAAPQTLERSFRFRPVAILDSGANAFDNEAFSFDRILTAGNYAYAEGQQTGAGTTFFQLKLQIPEIPGGTITNLDSVLYYEAVVDSINDDINCHMTLYNSSYASPGTLIFDVAVAGTTGGIGSPDTIDFTANGELPDFLRYTWTMIGTGGSDDIVANLKIFEVFFNITVAFDLSTVANRIRAMEFIEKIDTLYCGADGLTASFTNGSGTTAIYPHEIHRDMLYRFAGFDVATANMTNWTALNTARSRADSTWDARLWVTEPTTLIEILDRLQFEGGFIFKYEPSGGKYIYVADTYSAADVTSVANRYNHNIYSKDYTDLSVTLTPFNELITKTIWDYTRHPAKNSYINRTTYTNATARTSYWASISNEENTSKESLKYLVDNPYDSTYDSTSTPNDCIALYYDNIWADPKMIVNCTIVNPFLFDLQVGDIVLFDESYVTAGKSTTVYFMVTQTNRSIGGLSIECREVYDVA